MSKQRKSASKTPAKGKADKLITNAESPAAECSRPMPLHGKGRTGVAQSVFSAIAEQLRAIPGRTGRIIDAENTAGRLLAEALKHGAFARIKHTHLRTWIDGAIEKGLYHVAFGSAVNWFREYEPHWPAVAAWQNVGSSSCFKNGCPLLADVLEGESDVPEGERVLTPPVPGRLEAVAKAEELQRRQETARLSEQHLRRLGVVYGRRGVILGGQPPAAEAKAAAAEKPQAAAAFSMSHEIMKRKIADQDAELLLEMDMDSLRQQRRRQVTLRAAAAQADKPGLDATAAAAEPQADKPGIPDDGRPFYKPSYFQTWGIGDELLRRNSTDKKKYVEGKVRRQKKKPATGKGKRAVYWYSEPDVQKRWPDRFAAAENQRDRS